MQSTAGRTFTIVAWLTAVMMGASVLPPPATAQPRDLLTVRRATGVAFLGGTAFMVKQALDFQSEADDFFARYERATDPEEIDRLYQRTNNRDMKSQLSWALAAAFTVTGVRLIVSEGPKGPPERPEYQGALQLPRGLELSGGTGPYPVGLALRRRFF